MHSDFYGRHASDYFVPSYPYLFPTDPAPSFNGKQPNSGLHSEGQAVGGSYLFDGGYVGAAISRFTSVYRIPTLDGAQTNTRIDMAQTKITSKGEFRPQSSAIDVVRFWLGAVEYQHNELGFDDNGFDTARATFNNHAQEAKTEVKFMPLVTPFGSLISTIGTQFDHQQIDTAGDAGSLLGSARTNRGAAYFYNEFWLNDTLRTLLAGRIETVRLDGTAGIFPSTLLPPPDNPDLLLQSLGFMPKSISFSVVKDLPSWMVASATVQRIERAPTALELFAHGAHDAPGTFEIGNPGLKIETANTAELGLKRIDGAFRFDAKVYYTKYDNFIFRQATGILCGAEFATCGTGTEFIQTVYGQRDAIFRGGEMAWQWDLLPVATGIFGVDGQYDFVRATFTDGSNVPAHAANARRRRHLLAQRQLVRAHGPVARVRAERPRPERHADGRLQPAQDGDQQQAVLERFAVGRGRDHDRPRRRQPARRRCAQLRAIPQGRNPDAGAQHQVFHERQVRRRAAGQQGRLLQGADRLWRGRSSRRRF